MYALHCFHSYAYTVHGLYSVYCIYVNAQMTHSEQYTVTVCIYINTVHVCLFFQFSYCMKINCSLEAGDLYQKF